MASWHLRTRVRVYSDPVARPVCFVATFPRVLSVPQNSDCKAMPRSAQAAIAQYHRRYSQAGEWGASVVGFW